MIKVGQVYHQPTRQREYTIINVSPFLITYTARRIGSTLPGLRCSWRVALMESQIKNGSLVLMTETAAVLEPVNNCKHEFKNYVGLIESFDYCIHCDCKTEIKKAV